MKVNFDWNWKALANGIFPLKCHRFAVKSWWSPFWQLAPSWHPDQSQNIPFVHQRAYRFPRAWAANTHFWNPSGAGGGRFAFAQSKLQLPESFFFFFFFASNSLIDRKKYFNHIVEKEDKYCSEVQFYNSLSLGSNLNFNCSRV